MFFQAVGGYSPAVFAILSLSHKISPFFFWSVLCFLQKGMLIFMNQQFNVDSGYSQALVVQRKFCRKSLGRIALALVIALFMSQLVSIMLSYWISTVAPLALEDSWVTLGVATLPLYLCGLPLAWMVVRTMPTSTQQPEYRISVLEFLGFSTVAYSMLYIANIIGLLFLTLTEVFSGQPLVNPMDVFLDLNPLAVFVVSGLLAPIIEEFFFRGILLKRLLPGGEMFAIISTSVFFGLFHANPFQILFSFAVGISLAYITIRTGRLVYATLLHIIINSFNGVLLPMLLEYSQVLTAIVGLLILLVVVVGIVLAILFYKRIYILPPSPPLSTPRRLLQGFATPGVWLFLILSVGLSVFVVIAI